MEAVEGGRALKGRGHFDPAGAVPLSAGAWEVPSRRVANHTPSLVLEWVLVAGGSVAAWLFWTLVPARAEGLVTTLAHGWTPLCVALAALALLPHRDLRLANGSWRVWEVLLLLLRGRQDEHQSLHWHLQLQHSSSAVTGSFSRGLGPVPEDD